MKFFESLERGSRPAQSGVAPGKKTAPRTARKTGCAARFSVAAVFFQPFALLLRKPPGGLLHAPGAGGLPPFGFGLLPLGLQRLLGFGANAAAVGGAVPAEDFYYIAD